MPVLVVYASTHGSTREVAERIAQRIRNTLPLETVDVIPVQDAPKKPTQQAIVLGSAIHVGQWLSSARNYLTTLSRLSPQPSIHCFSLGMLEGEDRNREEKEVEAFIRSKIPEVKGHKQFGGRLDINDLNWFLKLFMRFVDEKQFPRGDRRSWEDIEKWGDMVGGEIKEVS